MSKLKETAQEKAPIPKPKTFIDENLGFCYATSWIIGILPLSTLVTMIYETGIRTGSILDVLFYIGEFYFFFSIVGCLLTALGFSWVKEIRLKYPAYRRIRLLHLLYLVDIILIFMLHAWLFNKIITSTPTQGLGQSIKQEIIT